MKNQKGITLVALVVTIVVLLILAGTSIAMLSGDNGIITNAQKATAANTEGQVTENIKNAYNTIKAEIIAKSATNSAYKATATDTTAYSDKDIEGNLALTVSKEILSNSDLTAVPTEKTNGYTIVYTPADHKIKITYEDSTFSATAHTVSGVNNVSTIEATFTISDNNVKLEWTSGKGPYFITTR